MAAMVGATFEKETAEKAIHDLNDNGDVILLAKFLPGHENDSPEKILEQDRSNSGLAGGALPGRRRSRSMRTAPNCGDSSGPAPA